MIYYFVGIKGAGMSSLAVFLDDLGFKVIGYDDAKEHRFTEEVLKERNIPIYTDPNVFEMNSDTIIVRSTAISDSHPEMQRCFSLGLKNYEYHEMLGKLSEKYKTITIAGCHGKTTTTSMISHILDNLIGCNYIIGDGTGHANKENKYFALEACEYKRHFLNYTPYYAIITNIELDHIDYYKSIDDMVLAYQEYARLAEKMVIACGDDPYTHTLDVNVPIFFYGLNDDNDIIAKDVEYSNEGTSFDVVIEDNYYGHFDLPLYGKHMLLNALAVIGVCYYERIEAKDVAKYLKTFTGAKRRFKEKVMGDIVTIDDYAHHPTEVKVTIKGARQKYPDKEIVAVLKTHTQSRTKEMAQEFADALNLADKSYIMDVNVDREEFGYDDVTYEVILDKLKNGEYISTDLASKLLKHKNAVILFMSSKEIYLLQEKYEELLKNSEK